MIYERGTCTSTSSYAILIASMHTLVVHIHYYSSTTLARVVYQVCIISILCILLE